MTIEKIVNIIAILLSVATLYFIYKNLKKKS